MLFSERLEELLKERKVTWKEVYTELHIGKNQKKYWADNDVVPELETLTKLAEYFGVSVDYLRGTDDLKEKATSILNHQAITLTAKEVNLILKYRSLDAEGQTMVDSTLIAESRRMESKKGEGVIAG